MTRLASWSVLVLVVAMAPAVARADGFFVPFYGQSFGGVLSDIYVNGEEHRPSTWGIAFGSMGGGVFGFESEVAFSPDFFGESENRLIGDNSVTTFMGNMLLGAPVGGQKGPGFRPYLVGGLGLIRQRLEGVGELAEISNNGFGYDVGAGAFIFFGKSFGIRGDFRYFRTFGDQEGFGFLPSFEPGDFSFTRWNGALVFRF